MVNIVVITHGEFGAYLVESAEEIVGRQKEGVRCVGISPRLSVEEVRSRLTEAVSELHGKDGVIVAVDMPGGTPCNVAMPLLRKFERISVVSGVNLYMLVTAFNYRKDSAMTDLVEKMISSGKKSIADMKALFMARR